MRKGVVPRLRDQPFLRRDARGIHGHSRYGMDQLAQRVGSSVEQFVRRVLEVAAKVPGSVYVGRYILNSHQNDPARTAFEVLLFLFALHYFFASKQSYSKRDYVKLSDEEVDELIQEWRPEPLVKPLGSEDTMLLSEIPELTSANGAYVTITESKDEKLLNLASTDMYGISTNQTVKEIGIQKLHQYGVGSCGPAGFYGNEDVHVDCEKSLARFLGTQSCILYSQGLATAPSVIPCFAKRGDVLVVDDAVSMALQRGVQLSRANVLYFAHNDMEDLERQLAKAIAMHRGKRLPRRFIVTEGLFEYTGNSPDLARIVELKHRYKFRIILDESWSLGVLGKTGRGLVEEQGVDRDDIDVTIGSLATALGMYGGFCAGRSFIVEHQRIVSLAYTFSATEPPYLAGCTGYIADQMSDGAFASRIAGLRERTEKFTAALESSPHIDLISRKDSPMVIFRVNAGSAVDDDDEDAESRLLNKVVRNSRSNGVLLCRLGQIAEWETFGPVNAIKLFLPEAVSLKELLNAAETIMRSVNVAVSDELNERDHK